MKSQKISAVQIGILAAVVVLAAIASILVYRAYLKETQQLSAQIIHQEKNNLNDMSQRLEQVLTQIYQGARTISLLPSIRSLSGDNLPAGFPEKTDSTRFNLDGQMTVQQIYNNLASNISVSEIYGILQGFRPEAGETPFFMYDELILKQETGPAEAEQGQVDHDYPEESEDAEYLYYKKQLQQFADNYPTFRFAQLDEIPMLSSPPLRTCDNTQYTSIKHGNVKDSFGILFSVPFYNTQNQFNGLISVIVRSNVFEAMLLGVPHLLITNADLQAAQNGNWTQPEHSSHYILSHDKLQINIFDRRFVDLPTQISSAKATDSKLFLEQKLELPVDNHWTLSYLVDENIIKAAIRPARNLMLAKLAGLILVTTFIFFFLYSGNKKNQQIIAITDQMQHIAHGDLAAEITIDGTKEVKQLISVYGAILTNLRSRAEQAELIAAGDLSVQTSLASERDLLGQAVQHMSDSLRNVVVKVRSTASQVDAGSNKVATTSQTLSQNATEQAASLEEIISTLTEYSAQVKDNAEHASKACQLTEQTSKAFQDNDQMLQEMSDAMADINQSSQEMSRIIKVIDEIAFQTNLLALNAAVEAARAGQHGKGFAVVAEEVRNLAARSAKAASETSELINSSLEKTERGSSLSTQSATALHEMVEKVQATTSLVKMIASSSNEQTQAISELNESLEHIDQGIQSGTASAEECAATAEELSSQATELLGMLDHFKLGEGSPQDRSDQQKGPMISWQQPMRG